MRREEDLRDDETGNPELDQLLRWEAEGQVPEARLDLVHLTIRRVRNWVLVGDLLRLATLEALWKTRSREESDAKRPRARQDR